MKIKKKKGFTLIELLIVVAIIAILAAIAIPQFSAYRIKGYNAAASSDIRNGKTAEEALFADFQGYGNTGGNASTVDSTSPAAISFNDQVSVPNAVRTIDTALSNGVSIIANSPAGGTTARPSDYTIFTKHTQGDRIFAGDGNDTILRWKSGGAGTALATSDGVASTGGGDITTTGYTAL